MKKIYLVSQIEVVDYEDFSPINEAFVDFADAKNRYQELKREIKSAYDIDPDDTSWVEVENDNFYSLYKDGDYSNTHVNITITELEVQQPKPNQTKSFDYAIDDDDNFYQFIEDDERKRILVYDDNDPEPIGYCAGLFKDYKTRPDHAEVDFSNIDDEKLVGAIIFL